MFIAKVIGSVVSTQKTPAMVGRKLLLIEPFVLVDSHSRFQSTGRTLVAVDTVGAGENEFVLIVQGSSARMTPETKPLPTDATAIGIIDAVNIDRKPVPLN